MGLRKSKGLPDLADLGGVACRMRSKEYQKFLAGDRAYDGMGDGMGAHVFVAMLDEFNRTRAVLLKLVNGCGERREPAGWMGALGSIEFSGAVGAAAEKYILAAAITGRRAGSQVRCEHGEHAILGSGNVFDAIEHGPLIRSGTNLGLLVGDVGDSGD